MSRDLTFPAGSRDGAVQCLGVSIVDDGDASEQVETFTLTLTTLDTVILTGNATTIIITDSNGS